MAIVDLLPTGPIANPEHVDAFLELTYLMIAADGRITDEERLAFGQITGRLRGTAGDGVPPMYRAPIERVIGPLAGKLSRMGNVSFGGSAETPSIENAMRFCTRSTSSAMRCHPTPSGWTA